MECFETSSMTQDSNLYDTIKEAILQLNIWLTSIEDSIKEDLTISIDERAEKYKEIHNKMKTHQDCLMRIVKICQNLSKRTELIEMNTINEYIMFVMDRFEKIRENIETSIKMNETEIINNQCKEICDKMNEYKEMLVLLYGQANDNLNNKNQPIKLSAQLNKIKYLFNRYTEELETIHTKLKNVNENEFEEYNTEMQTLFKSIKMIEDSMEQQWRSASELFMPYKMHSNESMICFQENLENATKIRKNLPIIFNYSTSMTETLTNLIYVDTITLNITFVTESISSTVCECSVFNNLQLTSAEVTFDNFGNEKESHILTVEPLKIYSHSCNVHYLLREIPIYKLATFQSLESSHTSPYLHFSFPRAINVTPLMILKIYHEPYKGYILDLQIDSLCSIPNSPCSTTVYKCAPHFDFLCFLNKSVTIISTQNVDTDEELYKHMVKFESLHKVIFERDYELFSEECFTESDSLVETLEYDMLPDNYRNKVYFLKMCKKHILPSIAKVFGIDFSTDVFKEIFTSTKYTKARAKLSMSVISFVKNHFQFDIGFGSILFIKNAFYQMLHIFQFDQWIRSILEIHQYRLVSAPL